MDGQRIEIAVDDWPRCTECNLPVEEFHVIDTGQTLIMVSKCHGQIEERIVPQEFWNRFVPGNVTEVKDFDLTNDGITGFPL